MENLFHAVHNYVDQVTNTNEKRKAKETIKTGKAAVACIAKENMLLKESLKVAKESELVFRANNTIQLI